jgi:hypothetical protein
MRQTDRQTHTHKIPRVSGVVHETDRHTDTQTDRQTHTHTHTHTQYLE